MGDTLSAALLRQIVLRHPDAALLVDARGEVAHENDEALALARHDPHRQIELIRTDLVAEGLALVVLRDVTERNALRAHACSTERIEVHAQLAAEMAHELASPLHTLGLSLDLLQSAPQALQRRALEDARMALAQMQRLVSDLRMSGDGHREVTSVDVAELLDVALRLATPALREAQAEVEVALGVDGPALASAGPLVQVLTNLVVNAAQALEGTRGPRRIRIETSGDAHAMRIEVSDTGPGIAPEVLARVFEPRFTTKRTGMGLGLSTCRTLVERLGGDITIDSKRGAGTRVSVRLLRT